MKKIDPFYLVIRSRLALSRSHLGKQSKVKGLSYGAGIEENMALSLIRLDSMCICQRFIFIDIYIRVCVCVSVCVV